MKLVRATKNSKIKRVRIKELGRMANEGETFEVTDDRYQILSGKNSFKVPFVTLVRDLSHDYFIGNIDRQQKQHAEAITEKIVEDTSSLNLNTTVPEEVNITPVVDEVPEIYVIEPGKDPVKVDENLQPIVEEKPKETKTKSKKKSKKVKENE